MNPNSEEITNGIKVLVEPEYIPNAPNQFNKNYLFSYNITITNLDGEDIVEKIPGGPELIIKQGQKIKADEPLTNNPNVGGFGQMDTEIVLQNPTRIFGLLVFFVTILLTQIFLVLKKKQFEKVQLAEMNF